MYTATGTYSVNSVFFGEPREKTVTQANNRVNAYTFGFNGQEKDNEVSGFGNSNTAEFWQYDSRLGRRFNMDPVIVSWESPYACFRNNPNIFTDVKGDNSSSSSAGPEGFSAMSTAQLTEAFNAMNNAVLEYSFNQGKATALAWGNQQTSESSIENVKNRSLNGISTGGTYSTLQNSITITLANGKTVNALLTVTMSDKMDNTIDAVEQGDAGGYFITQVSHKENRHNES